MKRLLVSAAVVGLISASPVFGQSTASDTATTGADAYVVAPISISNGDGSLSFGSIAAPVNSAGTVSVDANGDLTANPTELIVPGSTGSVPTFTVSGELGQTYVATLDGSTWGSSTPVDITLTGPGSATMTAHIYKSGGNLALDGTSGQDTFKAIGTLDVNVGQTPGPYNGTFDVTVAYN